MSGWLTRTWYDDRLVWNASDYDYVADGVPGTVDSLNRRGGIWTPDLELWEASEEAERIPGVIHVSSDGFVHWNNPEILHFRITNYDTKDFPYDSQTIQRCASVASTRVDGRHRAPRRAGVFLDARRGGAREFAS